MRHHRQILVSAVLILGLSYLAVAQTSVSDTKLMQLKGQVKTLVSTSKSISGYAEWVLKDKTKHETTYQFDLNGVLTEEVYTGSSNSRVAFSKVDGYKTLKSIKVEQPKTGAPKYTGFGSSEPEKPIEPNEKLTAPDNRFDFKYVYETDNSGKVTVERQYGNTGKLFRKRTFEYGPAGNLVQEREEDSVAVMKYKYRYDDAGTLFEVNETRDIKGAGADSKDRIVYSDYKFDSMGNWTERKSTTYSNVDGMPQYNIPAKSYTFVNLEFRTIIYY